VATVSGCGSAPVQPAAVAQRATPSVPSRSAPAPRSAAHLGPAERPRARQFPAAGGRTLQQLAGLATFSAQLGAATGTFTPGSDRYAFGLNASSGEFIYAPTAVYIASSPTSPAQGPFLAPADPLYVAPTYRSEQADPDGIAAVYHVQLPLPRAGVYSVLAVTRTARGLVASPGEIAVAGSSPIPGVGQAAPAVDTDTLASVHGDLTLVTTRLPPENMHSVSFKQVLGRRPVVLLFSTPSLCKSRICGPVTDITVQLQHEFPQVVFLHEEIYVGNDPSKGLRPQMKAFHLQTEPWLFAVNRRGTIAARLEGAFGLGEGRAAVDAALG
jgi:hypothetical protein